MTPYELRFEIFKQAYNMLNDNFCVDYDYARAWNENSMNKVKMDLPEFPTLNEVLKQAEVINTFVSETKQVSNFLKELVVRMGLTPPGFLFPVKEQVASLECKYGKRRTT